MSAPLHDPHDDFSPAPIPRLSTPRLLLREPRLGDFAEFAAGMADPLANVHTTGSMDPREAWRRFHALAGNWLLQGIGWWIIEERQRGHIGSVGVFRRETGPELEMGWFLHRAHWGHGYATEAARAALDWVVAERGADRVIANIAKQNDASMRVADKIGMKRVGERDFYGEVDWLYAFTRG